MGTVNFSTAPLLGMIYDSENLPCLAASVMIDGNERAQTDVNGRFVASEVSKGEHTITIVKKGFETLTIPFNFLDRKQILYLKVISLKQILAKIEENLAQKRMKEVEEYIVRANAIDEKNPVLMYITALFHSQNERNEEAVAQLEKLLELGYKEPVTYLTLADLYEYRLRNYEKAVLSLKTYIKLRPLPEIRERMEDIAHTYNLLHLLDNTKTQELNPEGTVTEQTGQTKQSPDVDLSSDDQSRDDEEEEQPVEAPQPDLPIGAKD
jgi:tetratricopeptide (TPR) repeat protein